MSSLRSAHSLAQGFAVRRRSTAKQPVRTTSITPDDPRLRQPGIVSYLVRLNAHVASSHRR